MGLSDKNGIGGYRNEGTGNENKTGRTAYSRLSYTFPFLGGTLPGRAQRGYDAGGGDKGGGCGV